MTITIDGTSGIASVDGSAGSPSVRGSDANSGIVYAADTVSISTGGTERFVIDSSGNLQSGASNLTINGSSLGTISFKAPDGGSRYFFGEMGNSASAELSLYDSSDSQKCKISADSSQNSFFNSGGKLLVGMSSPSTTTQGMVFAPGGESVIFRDSGINLIIGGGQSGQKLIEWRHDGTGIGTVTKNGTSGISYTSASDYRLKENNVAISDGITRLKTLKPYRFNFKVDPDSTVDGFFAHEVSPVVPEAITGTKDEVDSDDKPVYQGIDQSKLVPLLTAALQEAITKIETLETKVAALEAA